MPINQLLRLINLPNYSFLPERGAPQPPSSGSSSISGTRMKHVDGTRGLGDPTTLAHVANRTRRTLPFVPSPPRPAIRPRFRAAAAPPPPHHPSRQTSRFLFHHRFRAQRVARSSESILRWVESNAGCGVSLASCSASAVHNTRLT